MLIDGGKPMRQNQWKKAGLTVLSAVFMGSLSLAAAGTGIPALAATKDVAVTEYDEAALEKFKDNTLEYWELPGLIERYNTDYQNQLQKYYYNPGGSTDLTKDQMSALAADLRAEADEMERDANDVQYDETVSRDVYKGYKANMHALRAYAQQLEDAAKGKGAGGSSALRGLRIARNEKTKTAREAMRTYETSKDQYDIAVLNQEIAKQNYEAALKKKDLGMMSTEDVLTVEDALNSANGSALQAASSLNSQKQTLITMLGWEYNADPEITKVPEPDLTVIDSFDPKKDEAKAIEMNYTLYDTRMAKASSSGGAVEKARNIKDQEDSIRSALDLMYQDVKQKQKAYEASETLYGAAKADKAAADRKNALGMMSRQEYLQAESAWLSSEASHTAAKLDLTGVIENYQWALEGLLDIGSSSQS